MICNAVFVMVSVATTRAIAVGLLYVLAWETLPSTFAGGVRLLPVSHYGGLGIATGFANDTALQAGLTVATSVVMGVIVTGLALALAVNLLSSFTLKGEPAWQGLPGAGTVTPVPVPGDNRRSFPGRAAVSLADSRRLA